MNITMLYTKRPISLTNHIDYHLFIFTRASADIYLILHNIKWNNCRHSEEIIDKPMYLLYINATFNISYKNNSKNAWEKIKLNDKSKLDLDLLKKICQFREEKSKKRNIPKSWFLRDKDIIKICCEEYTNITYFMKTNFHENKYFYEKDYDEIFNKFKLDKKKKLNKIITKVNVKRQKEILKKISSEFNVSESLIANKKELEKKFSNIKKYNVIGWRKQFFETIIQRDK